MRQHEAYFPTYCDSATWATIQNPLCAARVFSISLYAARRVLHLHSTHLA